VFVGECANFVCSNEYKADDVTMCHLITVVVHILPPLPRLQKEIELLLGDNRLAS
jgi:hypothetical protein